MMTSIIVASAAFPTPTVGHDHHDADDKYHLRIPCISNDDEKYHRRTVPNVTCEMYIKRMLMTVMMMTVMRAMILKMLTMKDDDAEMVMMMIMTTRKMMTSIIVSPPAFPTVRHDQHDADDKYHRSIPCISNCA